MSKIFISIILCVACLNAGAAEYWLDLAGTGSGSTDGSSVNNLCAGTGDASCTPSPGDTVHLCNTGATFTPYAVEGTSGARITYISSCDGGTNGTISAAGQTYGVNITDREYLTFTGLDVDGPNNAGYLVNCTVGNSASFVRIEDADVTNVAGNGATIGNGFRWFCADVTLWNTSVNEVWSDAYYCDTCDRAVVSGDRTRSIGGRTRPAGWYAASFASGDANGDGIQIVDGDNAIVANGTCEHPLDGTKLCIIQSSSSSTGGYVFNNYIREGVDGGISWVSPNASIVANEVWNVSGGGSGAAIGIKLLGTNQIASGNIVVDAKKCFFSDQNNTTVKYVNNVCWGFRDRGMDANTANTVTLEFSNNIVVGLSTLTSTNRALIIGAGVTESLKNNDYYNLGSAQFTDSGVQYANFTAWAVTAAKETGSVSVDPLIIGGSMPAVDTDFKLKANSALRRGGADLNLGNYQDQGNRAFSHPPSIGAYEVTSNSEASNRTTASARTNRN